MMPFTEPTPQPFEPLVNNLNLPKTAWEQAVFVCLIIVVIGLLMYWLNSIINRFQNISEANNAFIAEQNKNWQEYLSETRQQYCDETARLQSDFSVRNQAVVENLQAIRNSIDANTTKLETNTSTLNMLSARFDQAVNDMNSNRSAAAPSNTKTRRS